MLFGLSIVLLCGALGRHTLILYHSNFDVHTVRRALPWPPNKDFFFLFFYKFIRHSRCANLIESHAFLQSSHGCKLKTVAWFVELTYVHVVFICEEFVG